MLRLLLTLLSTTALAIDAPAPSKAWKEANRTDDFVIFTQEDPATNTRKLLAITDLPQPPESVFQVVTDFAHYTKFMPYMKECRILKQQDPDSLTCYQLISPPLVSERDYIIQVKLTRGPANNGIWKSEWTAQPDAQPERSDIVRVKLNTGSWTLAPGPPGKGTRVTYTLHTTPGGSIPAFVANKSNTVAIPDLFKAIKERSAWQQTQSSIHVKAAESIDRTSLAWVQKHKCGSCHTGWPFLSSRAVLDEQPSEALAQVRAFFEGLITNWDAT